MMPIVKSQICEARYPVSLRSLQEGVSTKTMIDLEIEQDSTRRKNQELDQALRERTRKHVHTQELYDKLKAKTMMNQMQNAVVDAVDESIQASVTANRYADVLANQNMQPPQPPMFSNAQSTGVRRTASYPTSMGPPPNPGRGLGDGNWAAGFVGPPSSRAYFTSTII